MITRLKDEIASEEKASDAQSEELNMIRHASDESSFEDRMSTYEAEDDHNARRPGQGVFI